MASGIKANGTDLDSLFDLWVYGAKAPATGIKTNGQDVADRYQALSVGLSSQRASSGIKTNGADLSTLFGSHGSTNVTRQTSRTTSRATSRNTTKSTTRQTSVTTTRQTDVMTLLCVMEGTFIEQADGSVKMVDHLKVGDHLLSIRLPGLQPETVADYVEFETPTLEEAEHVSTQIASIQKEVVNVIYDIRLNGSSLVESHVTPSHPFLVWDVDGYYHFKTAETLTLNDCIVGKDFSHRTLESVSSRKGSFTIYKIDCDPYDLFIHDGLVAHNMKPGGGTRVTTTWQTTGPVYHNTTFNTTADTTWNTNVTTTYSTSLITGHSTTRTTSRSTSWVTNTTVTTTTFMCVAEGTPILLGNGGYDIVDHLKVGDELTSAILPGLQPETVADYSEFEASSLGDAETAITQVAHIQEEWVDTLYEVTINGVTSKVTPSHPFLVKTQLGYYSFKEAQGLTLYDEMVDVEFHSKAIETIRVKHGHFKIYKIDCSPYDLYVHDNLFAHNMKLCGGNYVSTSWPTSWTTTATTSFPTSWSTS